MFRFNPVKPLLASAVLLGLAGLPASAEDAAPAAPTSAETAPASPATNPAPAPIQASAATETAKQGASAAIPEPASLEAVPPKHVNWSFYGPFGTYDRETLQRGFQVYKEVCSACHALSHVAFRNLGDAGGPGFTEAQVKAIAAGYKVPAGPDDKGNTTDDKGQPLMRAAVPSDYIPPPFPNEAATRAANNGALPPDLSMVVKAREGHEDYVYSIVTGDGMKPPANMHMTPGMNYDPYFPGHQIAMPPPLTMGSVTFADGTPNTIDEEAQAVVTFLSWAAEPKMEERKRTGFNVMIFLFIFTGLLYFSYRKVWHGHH